MLMPSLRFTCAFRHITTAVHHQHIVKDQFLRMASTLPKLPVFEAIINHDPKSTAIVHCTSGRRFTYGELLKDVADARDQLRRSAGGQSLDGQRVAFLVENSYDYVGATQIKA